MTNKQSKLDANQLLQDWNAEGKEHALQVIDLKEILADAEPLVLLLAREVGVQGKRDALKGADRQDAVMSVVEMMRWMDPDDRRYYERRLSKAMGLGLPELRGLVKTKKDQGGDTALDLEPIYTTGGWIQGHLVELMFDEEKMETRFAVRYPDERVEGELKQVKIEGQIYRPIFPNSVITKGSVLLPSALGELMSEEELISLIGAHIKRYFDFGSDIFFEELTPLYVLFTYLFDGFMEVSYLRGLGDYGTGKTRFLKAVGKICYRPIYVTGGSSAASLFRLLDLYRGTLVLNEADFGQSDEATIIAKILNGGTERGESITRVKKDSGGDFDIEAYDVFGCKVIVTRKSFDDRAIESRCLTMEMVPMMPHPRIPQSLPPEFDQQSLQLRNALTTYRLYHSQENFTVDQEAGDRSIEPRLNQVTLSLMSTVKSDETRERIRAFLRDYNQRTRSERYEMTTARIVEGLSMANAWGPVSEHPSDEGRIYLKDIAMATNKVMDEQNRLMGELDEENNQDGSTKRKKMTSKSVSSTMKKYLQLRTERATDGTNPAYKGTYFVDLGREEERVKALCERWGVTWLERNTVERPLEAGGKPKNGIEAEREAWRQETLKGEEDDE